MKYPFGQSTRDAFGEVLVEIAERNNRVIVLDADLSKSTKTYDFSQKFTKRFIQLGIAEQNMIGVAAGLASCDLIPIAASFACFITCRTFDQLRVSVAQAELNVKLIGTHGGISPGQDGPTQQSVEDISLALALPGFAVLVPSDAQEAKAVLRTAVDYIGPVYVRLGRPPARVVYSEEPNFKIGKADLLRQGMDVSIIACGHMVAEALEAADYLSLKGIEARVINMTTIRPLDEIAILSAAHETRGIVVVEEQLLYGGLGSEVARFVSRHAPVNMDFIGLTSYAESGTRDELFDKYGLLAKNIEQSVINLLAGIS